MYSTYRLQIFVVNLENCGRLDERNLRKQLFHQLDRFIERPVMMPTILILLQLGGGHFPEMLADVFHATLLFGMHRIFSQEYKL